jgi:hypothetical protein
LVSAYLLVGVHGSEASAVRRLTALLGDVLNLLFGAVGEVAGVGVVGHSDGGGLNQRM